MPVKYNFSKSDCPSFGGASLSTGREKVVIEIYHYLEEMGSQKIDSISIQNAINHKISHNNNDTRSVIKILKKFGFTNIESGKPIQANRFFTKIGKAFALILEAKHQTSGKANQHINKACQLMLQDAIWNFIQSEDNSNLGVKTILNIIGITRTLSLNEYCYALSELKFGNSYNDIANDIICNRNLNVEYQYTKVTSSHGLDIEKNIEESILQSSREILQQAGILRPNQTLCEILNNDFLEQHNFLYYE